MTSDCLGEPVHGIRQGVVLGGRVEQFCRAAGVDAGPVPVATSATEAAAG